MRDQLVAGIVRRSVNYAQPVAQAYAEGNMNCAVLITRPAPNVFDRSSGGWTNPADPEIYAGPARITQMSGGLTYSLGEEQQFFSQSSVSVPMSSALIEVNDDVQITSHPDASLEGRHYRVTAVDNGGAIAAVRRLTVTGAAPAPNA